MTNSPQTSQTASDVAKTNQQVEPTPGRCFRGALISGGMAFAMYLLTRSIIQTLANTPLPNKSVVAANIAVAVRTLVIGVVTMGTCIFAISTLGLLALAVQLLIQKKTQKAE